jgi:hypothetical protein
MTIQGIALGLLIAVIPPASFHLLRGGSLNRFLLMIAACWIGFFSGHFLGQLLNWHLIRIGVINLFPALFAELLALVLTILLAGPDSSPSGLKRHSSRRRRPK